MNENYDELTKIDIILERVEEECVKEGKSLASVLDFIIGYDGKYLRNYFSFVADMSLHDYVRRRRLTEAYKKISDISLLRSNETVAGIKFVKNKIVKEFGSNPKHLQPYLYEDVSRQELERRLIWKQACGLKKRKIVDENRIVLFSHSKNDENRIDWESTYCIWGSSYISLQGEVSYTNCYEKMTNFPEPLSIGKYLKNERKPSEYLFERIYDFLAGHEVQNDFLPNLILNIHKEGGFHICSLIESCEWTSEKTVNVKADKRLRIENDKLVLYLNDI